MPRVLVFGDSFTAGDAVPNHERYTDLLETGLGAEVYNFGLSSTGTDQQYLAWREFARDIEHDVVVIAVFVENVRRVMARYRPHRDASGRERIYAKPYFTLDGEQLQLHHVPPRAEPLELHEMAAGRSRQAVDAGGRFPLLRKVVNAIGAKEAVQRLTHYQPLPDYDSPDTDGWRLMRAILTQWVRALDRPVVLMPLPLPQHIDEVVRRDRLPGQVRRTGGGAGLHAARSAARLPQLREGPAAPLPLGEGHPLHARGASRAGAFARAGARATACNADHTQRNMT